EKYEREINRYFREAGVGWQLVDGTLEVRGPEPFESSVRNTSDLLAQTGRLTASSEFHEALVDLSRRPDPDLTGALQHGMAALECVARDLVGEPNATLGDIIRRNPGLMPRPLDTAVEKLWGFASDRGR